MKKLFFLFVTFVATTTLWAHDFEVDGIYYNYLEDNNVEVTYKGSYSNNYSNEYSGEVTIPSTVTYNGTTYSVTSIGENAFYDCSSLTSITIPNSVTSIGRYAFCACSSLTSVTIPNSVTSIRDWAFYNCSSLATITIPSSVTSIGDWVFQGCSSLPVENNLRYADTYLVEEVNYTLSTYSIKEGTKWIGSYAFRGCFALTSITIPNSVTSIGGGAFWECSSLTSITIPNSVTSIGGYAFYNCSSLASITIPNSVTSIGDSAFRGCSALTSITIPNSVTSIGDVAFRDCSSLTSVTIGNSVTNIGEWAFDSCSSLTSVTIGNSVTTIEHSAFVGCTSLTSVTIPNSVTTIESQAFWRCSSLTSVTIGNNVTSIGGSAFRECSSLTKTNYTGDVASWCNIKFGYYDANPIFYSHKFYINDQEIKDLVIPNTVDSIHDYAFSGCRSIFSITCEATTPPTIGSYTFFGVYSFSDGVSKSIPVYIPCGTISAYNTAQYWNEFTNFQEPLAEYSINVSTANNQMGTAKVDFNNCATAQISATANYHHYCFVQWSDGNTDNPRTLVLTQDTTFTAEFAQAYSGLCGDSLYWEYDSTNKTISITGSGDMYNYTADTQPWLLFKEEIAEVTISNTATSIGTSAFEGCIRLGKVSIGTATKNIAANAFAACTKLYDIYCLAAEPPTGYTSSFANYNAFLHVPCESQRLYMLDILFGEFKYIECIASDEVPTDDIVITPGSTDVTITWPTEGNADTYTIVIKKDGEVVCTLTFNAEGQLLNIAFAPGRDGNHPAQYAEQVGNGYRFTVTGLEEGTDYTYDITVKDASNKTINSHSGKFTTESLTAVDNITTNNANIQKILRNGQLIILRNGVEYNAMGQEL